jgi:hypothetical protein
MRWTRILLPGWNGITRMRWTARACGLLLLGAIVGCAGRPYAHDPLLRQGRGVWGDVNRARAPLTPPSPDPIAPHAPSERTNHFAGNETSESLANR